MPKNSSPFNKGIGRLFSSSPGYVLEFFIENHDSDYSAVEIRAISKVSVKSLDYILPNFTSENIINNTRNIGKTKMYKLSDNPKVLGLIESHMQLKKEVK